MNGQAKIDFVEWVKKEYPLLGIDDIMPKTCINALKIEWFDTIGIYIQITSEYDLENLDIINFWYKIINIDRYIHVGVDFNTRQQATEKAIEKAIILYNEKFKENDR